MPRDSDPAPIKLIAGILAASPLLLAQAREALAALIAPVELSSEPRRWTESRYYCDEMGEEIWRQFVAFAGLAAATELAPLKGRTNELERRWAHDGARAVNLDPGYLDLQKLVLASTKDAAQRIYLGTGIYAEATLRMTADGFAPWPYTYPDYAAADAIDFFNRVRARYREERRTTGTPPDRRARSSAPRPLRSRE